MDERRFSNYDQASYLVANGFTIKRIDFGDKVYRPQTGYFVFEESEKLEKVIYNFKTNKKIGIQDFINAKNTVKHFLIDEQERSGVYKYGTVNDLKRRKENNER